MYPFNELCIIHSSLHNFSLIFTLQTSLIFLLVGISAKKKKRKLSKLHKMLLADYKNVGLAGP
jgi:hypothetical protein